MDVLYLLGSLAGVGLLVLLSAALFGTKGVGIETASTLEAYLAQGMPSFRARSMVLDKAHNTALAENDTDGTIHLVVARGDALVSRRLSRPMLRHVARRDATLFLRLADFTLPRAELAFEDAEAASQWEKKLWAL